MKDGDFQTWQQKIWHWCRSRPDILAALVIGSHGRESPPADELSDLDLIFFVLNPNRFRNDNSWLNDLGEVWIATLNEVGPGDPEWMTCFNPGLKVDFLFAKVDLGQTLDQMLDSPPYQKVLARGFRLLYESKSGRDNPVKGEARPLESIIPDSQEFANRINGALFTAERFVKFCIRDDIWRSQATFHCELKGHLLALIEWHALSSPNLDRDVWYEGRDLESWADNRVAVALPQLSPGTDRSDQVRAFLSLLDLLEQLAKETADYLGYEYPADGQQKMMTWLRASALAGICG